MKELRIGLVLYGGVSLAVYMNGIATEFWSALRASRSHTGTGGAALGGTPAVYRDLLQELEALTSGEKLRIVVDAVAGTSAGGVNGAALARAVVDGADASVLNRVWIEEADIAALRCDPRPAPRGARALVWLGSRLGPLATLRKSVETLSGLSWTWLRDTIFALITTKDGRVTPLNGRYFTQIIATSFKDMRTTGDGAALLPRRGTFDLFLTRTDLHGWPRHLPVTRDFHPSALFERTHAHVMAFRQRPGDTSFGDDFDLTFAARTTAGFPGAFAPVSYSEVAEDFRLARPGESVPSLSDFARRHLREHMLSAFPSGQAWMIDGGVLDNKPFSHVARAIEDKPADHQVYRIVVYVEPDPETQIDLPPEEVPIPLAILKGLYPLFRHEPIYEDLRRLDERNAKVERIRHALSANLPNARRAARAAGDAAGLSWPPAPADFERWRRLINDAAARDTLSGFPGYAQIKLRGAADVLSGVVCRLLDYPYHCSHGYFVRTLVRLWLARLEGPLDGRASDALEGRSDGDGLSEAQRELLGAFDIPFRIRRIRALVQAVNSAYAELPDEPEPRRAARGQLDACKAALADIAFSYESLLAETEALREMVSGTLGGIGTDDIDRIVADLRLDAAATVERYAPALERIYRVLLERFTEASGALNKRIADAVGPLPEWASERVATAFVTFAFTDLTIYPMMNVLGVTDLVLVNAMRISPQDATFLSQDPHRLKGRKLGAFAGFLKRCAREHDLLWGRLDGAERLIALVVTAAASAAGVDKDRRAALQREYTARAMRTIIDEEATRANCSILTTIASLRHALANKD